MIKINRKGTYKDGEDLQELETTNLKTGNVKNYCGCLLRKTKTKQEIKRNQVIISLVSHWKLSLAETVLLAVK